MVRVKHIRVGRKSFYARNKAALVRRVAPILLCPSASPWRTPRHQTKPPTLRLRSARHRRILGVATQCWAVSAILGRSSADQDCSASLSCPVRTYRFCSQSEVLASLFAQDWRRHVVGSFLSPGPAREPVPSVALSLQGHFIPAQNRNELLGGTLRQAQEHG